ELVRATNRYLEDPSPASLLVRAVAEYTTWVFKCLGLASGSEGELGFSSPLRGGIGEGGGGEGGREEVMAPVLDVVASFRDALRAAAIEKDAGKVLELCDSLRDSLLPPLGVRLEDKDGGSIWKLVDPSVLMKEKAQKETEEKRKQELKAEAAKKAAEKEARAQIPPSVYFQRTQGDKFSGYDPEGFPTHDKEGNPLSKGVLKKLGKEWEGHKKAYAKAVGKG
ncbi:hypothetical protein VYU27_009136, partial [Nannochloropsis oceanica]